MDNTESMKRIRIKEDIKAQCQKLIDDKIDRYLEIEHQEVIGYHYFAPASSECIFLYRDGYFIGAVMMSHAINEGIIKFVSERNNIQKNKNKGDSKTIEEIINELMERRIISTNCGDASMKIWKSYRNDIHHLNPKVAEINFKQIAKQNLKHLSVIEKEIFNFTIDNNGVLIPKNPQYWDIQKDGTTSVFLRMK